jgi:hypothetical protein
MTDTNEMHAKVLAQAVYEIRLLLGDYLGDDARCDPAVRQAAHLAYALHNEALAVVSGSTFDIPAALSRLDAVDEKLGSQLRAAFMEVLGEQD